MLGLVSFVLNIGKEKKINKKNISTSKNIALLYEIMCSALVVGAQVISQNEID
jgi:hypothetical protein